MSKKCNIKSGRQAAVFFVAERADLEESVLLLLRRINHRGNPVQKLPVSLLLLLLFVFACQACRPIILEKLMFRRGKRKVFGKCTRV